MLSTRAKLKEDYPTERWSTLKLPFKLVTPPLLLIIQLLPVITSNGTILRPKQVFKLIYSAKLRKTLNMGLKTRPNENVSSEKPNVVSLNLFIVA